MSTHDIPVSPTDPSTQDPAAHLSFKDALIQASEAASVPEASDHSAPELAEQAEQTSSTTAALLDKEYPEKKKWKPMECAPEILSDCVERYGVTDTMITEVYGEELFDMVPQPIEALICLFPVYDKITQYINETFPVDNSHPKAELFHMAQRIGNACGSFALFHTFLNLRQIGDVREDSILDQLLVKICELPPDADSIHCAEIFESQEGVEEIHQGQAVLGQTCNEDDEYEFTEVHYITFICKFDHMWLLDGAKRGPLDLGACSPDQLLSKAFKVVSEMHKIWGKETDFAVLACSKLE